MLGVEVDGLLNSLVTEDVTVGNVLGGNTGTGLLLLGDLIAVTLGVLCEVASVIIVGTRGTGDLDLCRAELGVIEEEGSLRSSLLFEGYGSTLCLSRFGDVDGADLTTEE